MEIIIQVGNLDSSVSDGALLNLFERHGTVCNARVAIHSENGRSTGVGFVEMDSIAGDAAIAALNRKTYRGLVLVVCRSRFERAGRAAATSLGTHFGRNYDGTDSGRSTSACVARHP